jgi:hypothetical protein
LFFVLFVGDTDVIALVNDPAVLTEERIYQILAEYNQQQMIYATAPNGQEVSPCLVLLARFGFPSLSELA